MKDRLPPLKKKCEDNTEVTELCQQQFIENLDAVEVEVVEQAAKLAEIYGTFCK